MHEDEILCNQFTYSAEDIRALRCSDETFDAICKDYLLLSSETSRALAEGKPGAERYLADASNSLSGLAEEIEARLRRFCSTDDSEFL